MSLVEPLISLYFKICGSPLVSVRRLLGSLLSDEDFLDHEKFGTGGRNWVEFFEKLGVGARECQEKRDWIDKIGTLASIRYEKSEDRSAWELPLTEAKKNGYDVTSESNGEILREIEVKSTGEHSDATSYIRGLSRREVAHLLDNKDKAYIYLVTDTLNDPELWIYPASELDAETLLEEIYIISVRRRNMSTEKPPVKILALNLP